MSKLSTIIHPVRWAEALPKVVQRWLMQRGRPDSDEHDPSQRPPRPSQSSASLK